MRKSLWSAIVALVVLLAPVSVAQAAAPADGPPGLARAILAQEAHNPQLLTTPGVVGTAVGLGRNGTAVIKVFTSRSGVGRVPLFLDGVPVVVQVTGELTALKKRLPPNKPPVVTIASPADGARYGSGDAVLLAGIATDKEDGDLSSQLAWYSSVDGDLGSWE